MNDLQTLPDRQAPAFTPARGRVDLSPQTFEQALTFCQHLAKSNLVPKDFQGRPENCLIAMQWGAELGLKPLQALQNLAVINGRPALWGDAVIALVRGSALCEYVLETDDGQTATCRVKRRGEAQQVRTFSTEDARKAGLLTKQGPWTQYPKRMRQMRARAFALRDVFPDVLRGIPVAEEVMDIPAAPGETLPVCAPAASAAPALPAAYDADKFAANLPAWRALIASGKKTADQIIATVNSKAPLTPEQQAAIRAPEPSAPSAPSAPPEPSVSAPAPAPKAAAAPTVTFEQIADALRAATDSDQLASAATLIAAIGDPQERAVLSDLYEQRAADLDADAQAPL